MWSILAKMIGLLALLLVVGWFVPVTRWRHTCVICRPGRVDSSYGPVPRVSRFYETDCSRWYAAHVERRHDHVWEQSTCVYQSDLYGFPRSVGCRPGHYPIWMLSPDTQMAVYQHFRNPLDAKTVFANLTDEKTYDDRLEEDFRSKGHHIVEGMKKWEDAGFPGEWNEWWGRYYENHLVEHKLWLEWLKADSGLNFWDWKKQRTK